MNKSFKPEAGDPLIRVRDIYKTYYVGEVAVPAVRGVSVEISTGDFLAIMGPSGSGKSTFMHLLGCLDRPDAGEYWLGETQVNRLKRLELASLRNRLIGFVFQSFNLLSRTTVLDNVALPLTYQGAKRRVRRNKAAEMLERVGLGNRMDHYSNQLSGGQQQRVAIARALVTGPVLLLADEPTGNLDTVTSQEIIGLFQELNRQTGQTIIVVTHESDIAAYARRVVTFRDGVIHSDVINEKIRDARVPMAASA